MENNILFTGITPDDLSQLILKGIREELCKLNLPQPQAPIDNEIYLSQKEAADYLKCSTVKLWRLRKKGVLKSHQLGRNVLYKKNDLTDFIEGKEGCNND